MPPAQTKRRKLNIYADRPLASVDDDALGFLAYADAFSLLINDAATATPLTMAITGPWGTGKTSLAALVEKRLAVDEYWALGFDRKPVVCWFNAWLHRDAEHLGAALAANVIRVVGTSRPWWWRLLSPLPDAMLTAEMRWWRRVWRGVVGAALALLTAMAVFAAVPGLRGTGGGVGTLFGQWGGASVWWATIPVIVALLRKGFKVTDEVAAFVDQPRSAAASGALAEVHHQVGRVIRQAQRVRRDGSPRRRTVIFVDDLERCGGDKALDVCEIASLVLGHPGVVTVLVADLGLLEAAAGERYQSPAVSAGRGEAPAGERYLQKLIQLRFHLPPVSRVDVAAVLARIDADRGGADAGRSGRGKP